MKAVLFRPGQQFQLARLSGDAKARDLRTLRITPTRSRAGGGAVEKHRLIKANVGSDELTLEGRIPGSGPGPRSRGRPPFGPTCPGSRKGGAGAAAAGR